MSDVSGSVVSGSAVSDLDASVAVASASPESVASLVELSPSVGSSSWIPPSALTGSSTSLGSTTMPSRAR